MILLTLALAFEPEPLVTQVAPAAVPAFDALATIDRAIALRQSGDLLGATTLLVGIADLIPAESRGWYLYQRGICEELGWKFAEAREFYRQALEASGDSLPDIHFRLALVLEDLGDPAGALAEMQTLARLRGLDEADAATVALQTAISEVNSGKLRRGLRHLEAALAPLEGGTSHTWLRAKGRYTLARALLYEADAYDLTGGERRVVRRLVARVKRIVAAEDQITALVYLKEPEWILASMLLLGDSYQRLGDALIGAPPPPRLTATEVEIYTAEVAKKAANAHTKAFHYWDQGVEVAARLGFESPKVQILKERRASLER